MNINVQQIVRSSKSSGEEAAGEIKDQGWWMGPARGRYNHIGHNLIEMEIEFEIHATGAARNWEADVGWEGRSLSPHLFLNSAAL